ncbi:MAG: hypothetical protein KAJ55_10085 [Anaerolineales bacterium]|nr:hypothetical protein [Anaerolineales bacterium]
MRKLLFVPLFLTMIAAGCSNALQTIGEGLNDAAFSIGEVQTIIIAAWENDVITKAQSDQYIQNITVPVISAIGHANTAVALLAIRDEVDRDEILEILPPVIAALNEALGDENLGIIENPATQAAVKLGLNGIVTALTTIQVLTEE